MLTLRHAGFDSLKTLLLRYSNLFFAPLALAVVNDDSARCRKMAAMAIKDLLAKVDVNQQNSLFSLVSGWLNEEKARELDF